MNEYLTKATHGVAFAVGSLQEAYAKSSYVEALLLIDLIEAAVELQQRIENLADAVEKGRKSAEGGRGR